MNQTAKVLKPEQLKNETVMTAVEVEKYLKVSRATLHRLEKKGVVKPVYLATVKRYRKSDIDNAFTTEKQ